MIGASTDGSFYLLDDQPNNFVIPPNLLASHPGGLLALGGNDIVTGSNSPELILGNLGDDQLFGGLGEDSLWGGRGNDILNGGEDDDLLVGNQGSDNLTGGVGDDLIWGGKGNDNLAGGDGDDDLIGGQGNNTLTGGNGGDLFVLDGNPNSQNLIVDFDNTLDKIGLAGGLTQNDLTLEAGSNGTVIKLTQSGTSLAEITGASINDLQDNFLPFNDLSEFSDDDSPATGGQEAITGNETVENNLSLDQVDDENSSPEDEFSLTDVLPNQTVTVTATSTDFVPKLIIFDVITGQVIQQNDDASNDNPNAQITFKVAKGSEYQIFVLTQNEQVGNYTLTTSTVNPPVGTLTLGQTLNGDLNADTDLDNETRPGSWSDDYNLTGLTPNQLVQIRLNSTEFNTKLQLINADTEEVVAENNNSFLDPEASELNFTVQEDVEYLVRVTSFSEDATGNYTLTALNVDLAIPPFDPIETLSDNELKNLARTLVSDRELNRTEMLQIFQNVEDNGTIDANEFNDLQQIIGDRFSRVQSSQPFKMSDPVWYLSEQVIKALTLDSESSQLTEEVNKWFKGLLPPVNSFLQEGESTQNEVTEPTLFPLEYKALQGDLFGSNQQARIKDIAQNKLADCYFLAAVGATFSPQNDDSGNQPSSIVDNMIIDNGDGSYTVRFYNEQPNTARPEYVTVDRQVVTFTLEAAQKTFAQSSPQEQQQQVGTLFGATPVSQEIPQHDDPENPNNGAIWMPLLERAYAQWHQELKNKDNGYSAIGNGGDEGVALRQITGRQVEKYSLQAAPDFNQLLGRIETALSTGQFVAAGTSGDKDENGEYVVTQKSGNLIVGGHAYSITNLYVDPVSGEPRIVVRNPWGVDGENGVTRDGVQDGFIDLSVDEFKEYYSNVAITKG